MVRSQLPPENLCTNYIHLYSDLTSKWFLTIRLLNVLMVLKLFLKSEYNCCVEKRKQKKREEQFSESLHCYSPTPPIGQVGLKISF